MFNLLFSVIIIIIIIINVSSSSIIINNNNLLNISHILFVMLPEGPDNIFCLW